MHRKPTLAPHDAIAHAKNRNANYFNDTGFLSFGKPSVGGLRVCTAHTYTSVQNEVVGGKNPSWLRFFS
jgi:hypothetical protein